MGLPKSLNFFEKNAYKKMIFQKLKIFQDGHMGEG